MRKEKDSQIVLEEYERLRIREREREKYIISKKLREGEMNKMKKRERGS